jgi:hypothetical protein
MHGSKSNQGNTLTTWQQIKICQEIRPLQQRKTWQQNGNMIANENKKVVSTLSQGKC